MIYYENSHLSVVEELANFYLNKSVGLSDYLLRTETS
jgi:hypothetical protein